MKKIFLIVLFIFIFCTFTINISAASWKFTWTNTVIYIPVGESIDDYKDIPKAQLYKDGFILSDAVISYNIEGDWMYYLSDVNTSKVGTYEVWYKAYETNKYYPGTCPGYKCKIKFIVIDDTPPRLDILEETVKLRRASEYDFNNNIRVSDNYSKELKVSFHSNVDFFKVGIYEVKVYVEDESAKYVEGSYNIEIYENTKPTIIYKNEGKVLKVPLNGEIALSNYFEAFDQIDGDISKYIIYPVIDNTSLGKNIYEIKVTNFANLSNSVFVEIEVVDDEAPLINVIDEVVILDYKTDISSYDFKKHIVISDNMEINYDNLEISHNILNEVGSYSVTYKYFDTAFIVTDTIELKMKSFVKPQIIVSDIICYENEEIDLYDYVTVIDDSDPNVTLKIYDDNIDFINEGVYQAEAYAINSSGLSESIIFNVTVISYEEDLSSVSDSNSLTGNNIGMSISPLDIVLVSAIGILTILVCIMAIKIKKNKSI